MKGFGKKTPLTRLFRAVAEAEGVSAVVARAVIERFHAEVTALVWAHGRFVLPRFVSFSVRRRKTRRIAHPVTGESMQLQAGRMVHARALQNWRRR
jgi:nucleoid DNA-binding protein